MEYGNNLIQYNLVEDTTKLAEIQQIVL